MSRSSAVLLSVLLVTLLPTSGSADWTVEGIDTPELLDDSDFAFDGAGNPAVAYGDDNLYYASWNGAGWDREIVEDLGGGCPTNVRGKHLTFDAAGEPAISYSVRGELRLARKTGGTWTIESIEPYIHGDHRLAFDPAGQPALAYWTWRPEPVLEAFQLWYARNDGAGWVKTEVTATYCGTMCVPDVRGLDHDSGGIPALVSLYTDGMDQRGDLHGFDGTSWQHLSDLEVYPGWARPDLAFAPDDTLTVGYQIKHRFVNTCELVFATWTDRRLEEEVVIDDPECRTTGFVGLKYESDGTPVMAYTTRWGPSQLELARRSGATWSFEVVTGTPTPFSLTTFDLDATDREGFSFYDSTALVLNTVVRGATDWEGAEVQRARHTGEWPALAFDTAGAPTVSYFDRDNEELRFARDDGSGWIIETIDSDGVVGAHSRIVYDAAGEAWVTYFDATNRDLKLARNPGSGWVIEVVDSDGHVGRHATLAFDPAGTPHICYYDDTNAALKLASWSGTAWDIQTVDAGEVVFPSAIAFDPAGRPALAWNTTLELRYALWNGTDWERDWVTEEGCTVIGLDFDGAEPRVFGLGGPGIRLFRQGGGLWPEETLVEAIRGEYKTWFTIDPAGNPAVAYMGFSPATPHLLRWSGSAWEAREAEGLEDVDTHYPSLAFGPDDKPAVAYFTECTSGDFADGLWIARSSTTLGKLLRGVVPALTPGWRERALPVGPDNTLSEGIFPHDISGSGTASDPIDSTAPLVLYRILDPDGLPIDAVELKAAKSPTGAYVVLRY